MAKKNFNIPGVVVIKEDDATGINQTWYEPGKVEKWISIGFTALVALVIFAAFLAVRFVSLDRKVEQLSGDLNKSIERYDTDVKSLSEKNEDLEEYIEMLSTDLLEKMEAEEIEDAKRIPSGLPVSGMVSIVSEPATAEGEDSDKSSVIFSVNQGSKVMSAGSGVVTTVTVDETYGFKVCLDHGNGYISEYCFGTAPKVQEGDEVMKGQLLYEAESNNLKLAFKVSIDGEYIDPMDILEING